MTTMNIRLGFASDQDGRPYTTWASAYVYDDSDSACYSNVMISRNGKFNIMTENYGKFNIDGHGGHYALSHLAATFLVNLLCLLLGIQNHFIHALKQCTYKICDAVDWYLSFVSSNK